MPRILAILLLVVGGVFAQTDQDNEAGQSSSDWIQKTDESPDTTSDWIRPQTQAPEFVPVERQTVTVLRAQAFSLDRESKMRAIRTLEEMHADGVVSPFDNSAIAVVAFLATESYDYEVIRMGQTINDFPVVRAEAVRLLGAVGGPVAGVALARVMRNETDLYVLSEAVWAVGRSAETPTPELLSILTELTLRMQSQRQPDNALALAILDTVDKLQSLDRPIDDPDLFRALIQLAQGGYSNTVRREALRLVNKLRRKEQ